MIISDSFNCSVNIGNILLRNLENLFDDVSFFFDDFVDFSLRIYIGLVSNCDLSFKISDKCVIISDNNMRSFDSLNDFFFNFNNFFYNMFFDLLNSGLDNRNILKFISCVSVLIFPFFDKSVIIDNYLNKSFLMNIDFLFDLNYLFNDTVLPLTSFLDNCSLFIDMTFNIVNLAF